MELITDPIGLHRSANDGHITAREVSGAANEHVAIGLEKAGAVCLRMEGALDHTVIKLGDVEVFHLQR